MNDENKRFAVYSRKSRFTGKGESIENQIELCRRYINLNYPNASEKNIFIYDGFLGYRRNTSAAAHNDDQIAAASMIAQENIL